jgi:Fic family protein
MDPKDFISTRAGVVRHSERGDWTFLPNPLPPKLTYDEVLSSQLGKALYALGELAGLSRNLPNPSLFIRPFLRQEAVQSSRIEGTKTTLVELLFHEARQAGSGPEGETSRDDVLVEDNALAIEKGLALISKGVLKLEMLNQLHRMLMRGMKGDVVEPGMVRDEQNFIGRSHNIDEAVFLPPPPEDLPSCLQALEDFLQKPVPHHPLLNIAFVHYQFEAIHPYLDGNGRMGRLLTTLLICRWGLLPYPLLSLSVFLEKNRSHYMQRLLRVSQRGEWEEWLDFFLTGIQQQSDLTVRTIKRMEELRKQWHEHMARPRMPAKLPAVLDIIFGRPVFQVQHLAEILKVGYPTVMHIVEMLEREGIVSEKTGGSRNRVYAADEVIRRLREGEAMTQLPTEP